nr:hypothetical protein [uncultured Mediterranean phage uvMED]
MTPDQNLTEEALTRVLSEIVKCERLLSKLWAEDSRREVLARRRTLYRILYAIPQGIPLPIDWQPVPHPQDS